MVPSADNSEHDLLRAIGARIAELRHGLGWTQEELARRVGLARLAIVRLEGGTTPVSLVKLAQIAQVLGVPVRELLPGQEGEIDPEESAVLAEWRRVPAERRDLVRRILRESGR